MFGLLFHSTRRQNNPQLALFLLIFKRNIHFFEPLFLKSIFLVWFSNFNPQKTSMVFNGKIWDQWQKKC